MKFSVKNLDLNGLSQESRRELRKWISLRFEEQEKPIGSKVRGRCWRWKLATTYDGYGHTHVGRKSFRAHRLSWLSFYGDIPDKFCVLHKCDNRACVRPSHLFLGTRKDNAFDMIKKGRKAKQVGELNSHAKVTAEIAMRIREEYQTGGYSQANLANKHGLCRRSVRDILNRKTWAHV